MTVVVTGGAGRIGSAIVQSLCQQGQSVLVQYHQSKDQAVVLQERWPSLVSLYSCDLTNNEELQNFIRCINQEFSICGLINNAGMFKPSQLSSTESLQMTEHWSLNAVAPVYLVQGLFDSLRRNNGSVVNIVDNVSHKRPWPNYVGYAASKAALVAATRALAVQLAPDVRINAVGPGLILDGDQDSPEYQALCKKIPMRRWGTPTEVAETVLFLLQGPAYITGQVLCVDGGWGLSP